MPIGTTAALIGGGAILGGVSGALGKDKESSSGINLAAEGELERRAREGQGIDYGALRGMVDAGPGQADVSAGYGAQKDLAALLKQYSEGGYLPTDADIATGNQYAGKLFAGQREAMNQAFQDQSTAANRQAALMGRSMNDPVLAAKLAQEQTRQSSLLAANQGAYATQMALQQPGQRLGFATDRANVLGGLATQAMANRQALLGMGQSIQQSERNFRLQTGTQWGKAHEGGGIGGAIEGALGGATMGMNLMKLGGFGSRAAAPAAPSGPIGPSLPGGGFLSGSEAGFPSYSAPARMGTPTNWGTPIGPSLESGSFFSGGMGMYSPLLRGGSPYGR